MPSSDFSKQCASPCARQQGAQSTIAEMDLELTPGRLCPASIPSADADPAPIATARSACEAALEPPAGRRAPCPLPREPPSFPFSRCQKLALPPAHGARIGVRPGASAHEHEVGAWVQRRRWRSGRRSGCPSHHRRAPPCGHPARRQGARPLVAHQGLVLHVDRCGASPSRVPVLDRMGPPGQGAASSRAQSAQDGGAGCLLPAGAGAGWAGAEAAGVC